MIGISPGTRSVGFAIIKDGTLIDWGVKLFKQEWSNEKLQKIIGVLDVYVQKYQISTVAIKQHPPFRLSDGLEKLYDQIRDWAKT
jgi:Holliday junction resolvasome RuvABC endonuclease subunit